MRMLYMLMKADRTMCLDLAHKMHLTSHAMENTIEMKINIMLVLYTFVEIVI